MEELATALAAALVGLGAGVLSGMFGIGGAVISTPAIRLLGATPIHAVGSTVPAILPGALAGTWRYHRAGLVDHRVAVVCGLSGSVAAVGGALVASSMAEPGWLMVLTAALMLWSGWSVARSARVGRAGEGDGARAAALRRSPGVLVAVGVCAGFVAGLLGVGGGILLLPAFTAVLGLPVKRAIASSLLAVAIFSVPALATHTLAGNIDWLLAGPMVLGVVPGAWIGARVTVAATDRRVRLAFGATVAVLALVYGTTELLVLRG